MFLKEPLFHFLVLGALIFFYYEFTATDAPADDEIIVSTAQQQRLIDAFSFTWKRQPTQKEFEGVVKEWLREEIAYREAVAMGLDSDDTIIRRRMRQKLEVIAEDIVSIVEPSKQELESFLADNQADYREEPIYSLRQIFFSTDARGKSAQQDAQQALLLLQTDDPLINPESLGDPSLLPHSLQKERLSTIAAQFGRDFSTALSDAEQHGWQGPIRSAYGLHLVVIDDYIPGRALSYEEAERSVRRDWEIQQRELAIDKLYERLGEKYTITIEVPATKDAPGS